MSQGKHKQGAAGLGYRQTAIMWYLHDNNTTDAAPEDIAAAIGGTRGNLTKALLSMFVRGLIHHDTHPGRYCLTRKGGEWLKMAGERPQPALPARAGVRHRQILRHLGSRRASNKATAWSLSERLGMDQYQALTALQALKTKGLVSSSLNLSALVKVTTAKHWTITKRGADWWRQDRLARGLTLDAQRKT